MKVSSVRVQDGTFEFDVDFIPEFSRFVEFDEWLKKPGGLYQAAGSATKIPQNSVAPTQPVVPGSAARAVPQFGSCTKNCSLAPRWAMNADSLMGPHTAARPWIDP